MTRGREGGREGWREGGREGEREGGREGCSINIVGVLLLRCAKKHNVGTYHRLTYILLQHNGLAWCASDPRCVGRLLMRLGLL